MSITLVVVDDDDVDRYLVKRVVGAAGIDARLVYYSDSADFMEAVLNPTRSATEIGEPPPPILVLLDINMPRLSGFEVLERLADHLQDNTDNLYVAVYSSSGHESDRTEAMQYRFVKDYFIKPLVGQRLKDLVTRLYS